MMMKFNFGIKLSWLVLLFVGISIVTLFIISNAHIKEENHIIHSLTYDSSATETTQDGQSTQTTDATSTTTTSSTTVNTTPSPTPPSTSTPPTTTTTAIVATSDTTTTTTSTATATTTTATATTTTTTSKDEKKYVVIPNVVGYDPEGEDPLVRQRRQAIVQAIKHAYNGYEDHCMGQSELKPVSGQCHNWMFNGVPLTAIDSLDTLLIVGLNQEYERALTYFKQSLNWNKDITVSVFETTIRCLGGFLTAYTMTEEPFFLQSAKELADKLLPAFDTPTKIPRSLVNLKTGVVSEPGWMSHSSVLAEIGTLQIEFATLSRLTKDPKYENLVVAIYESLKKVLPSDFLFPCYISPYDGSFGSSTVTLGGLGDSYYEYLLKYWLIKGKTDKAFGEWYYNTANSIIQNLAVKAEEGMWFLGERSAGRSMFYKMDHLACFAGAMFALGAQNSIDPEVKQKHMEVGEGIGRFCWEHMYNRTASGLSGEHVLVTYVPGQKITSETGSGARSWIMRPEAVETWFVLWRLTKNPRYREWAWLAFEKMNKHSRATFGYSGVGDVESTSPYKDDVQQSFFIAETLKYLYLMFAPDDVIPLDRFVFNTEAHPLLVFDT